MKISLNGKINEGCFVQCQVFDVIEYGSTIEIPPSSIAYVVNKTSKETYKFDCVGNDKFNDAPGLFKRKDKSGYLVYYINTSPLLLTFGDNVSCNIDGIDENIYYNVNIEISVDKDGCIKDYINALSLPNVTRTYGKEFVSNTLYRLISQKVLSIVDKYVQEIVTENKIEKFYSNIDYEVVSNLLSNELWNYNLKAKVERITLQEQEDIKTVKQDSQLKKWQSNN